MESKYAHVTNDPAIATAVIATHVVATSSTATPYLEVIAPATLPEGYEFEVEAPDGTSLKVHVPMGGVKEGQAFRVPSIMLHLRHTFQEMAFLLDIGVMVYVIVLSMDYAINICGVHYAAV